MPLLRGTRHAIRKRRRSAVAPFSPLDIPGLKLWLKADVGTFQSAAMSTPAAEDGDPVGGWQDQSGNGNHVTQATSSKKPTLALGAVNGLPALEWDGIDDALRRAGLTIGTWFLVIDWTMAVSPADAAISNDNDNHCVRITGDGTAYRVGESNDFPNTGLVRVNGANTTAITLGAWHIGTFLASSPRDYSTDGGVLSLGSDVAQSRWFTGRITEVLGYDSVLNSTNYGRVETYLDGRYPIF